MRRLGLTAALGLLLSGLSFGAPLCTSVGTTLQALMSAGTCMIGVNTYLFDPLATSNTLDPQSSFNYTGPTAGGSFTPLTASTIFYTVNNNGFVFTGNFTTKLGTVRTIAYAIHYTVEAPTTQNSFVSETLGATGASAAPAPIGTDSINVTEVAKKISADGSSLVGQIATGAIIYNPLLIPPNPVTNIFTVPGVIATPQLANRFLVSDVITLNTSSTTISSSLTGISNGFTVTPEPGTLVLFSLGLFGFAFRQYRRV
jgi:hypothetical protein